LLPGHLKSKKGKTGGGGGGVPKKELKNDKLKSELSSYRAAVGEDEGQTPRGKFSLPFL